MKTFQSLLRICILIVMVIGLPLWGIWITDNPVSDYLEFPPKTYAHEPIPFSWPVFSLMLLVIVIFVAAFLVQIVTTPLRHRPKQRDQHKFPLWGWLGILWLVSAWLLAWNRFSWFERWQEFTFTPLWLGYVIVINALTYRRSGRCMMLDRKLYFLGLFPLSAAFWWCYEYLNRFVQNWYYAGGTEFGSMEYFLHGTLPFATVLPAVLGTAQWLNTFPRVSNGLNNTWRINQTSPRLLGWISLVSGAVGLVGIAIWPDLFYPLMWLAPLLLVTGLEGTAGNKTPILSAITTGQWQPIWILALAGLVCGFFWELWNFKSLAHWVYTVPSVQRFHLFEMPLLGYAGYLPFGITCGAVANFVMPKTTNILLLELEQSTQK